MKSGSVRSFDILESLLSAAILYFNMNLEKSNRLFILAMAAGLLLVGTTVFIQGQSIMRIEKSIRSITSQLDEAGQVQIMQESASESVPNITRVDCMATGGDYKNDVCTCSEGYVLEGSQCVDSELFVEFGNVSARVPEGWLTRLVSRDVARAEWIIVDKASGEEKGRISCPIGGAGFEAWKFTESVRSYKRGSADLYAKKLIGEPLAGSGSNWLAMIWAGSTKTDVWDVDPTCMFEFAVSNPPTQKELLRIDMVHRSIK